MSRATSPLVLGRRRFALAAAAGVWQAGCTPSTAVPNPAEPTPSPGPSKGSSPSFVRDLRSASTLRELLAANRLKDPEYSAGLPPDWSTILSAALARNDDHDVKLALACREEADIHESLAYREVAATRLGLI